MFVLSGGCCDGSVPNCYKLGEAIPGPTMLLLGEVGGAPFYLGHQEFAYYGSSPATLDVQPGGGGFLPRLRQGTCLRHTLAAVQRRGACRRGTGFGRINHARHCPALRFAYIFLYRQPKAAAIG